MNVQAQKLNSANHDPADHDPADHDPGDTSARHQAILDNAHEEASRAKRIQQQQDWGISMRLAMACINKDSVDAETTRSSTGLPHEVAAIRSKLKLLAREISSNMADQLELLVRFDDQKGWQDSGAKHCVAWMDLELGISRSSGWERLRAGRKLRELPITRALFRAGALSWSKVRLITRVASEQNEALLCHASLDSSVSQVEQLVQQHRWDEDDVAAAESENALAMQRYDARSFTWKTASNGNIDIRLSLPPESAQVVLKSVEHCINHVAESAQQENMTSTQTRADAAILVAERSLAYEGRDTSTADRFQVVVTTERGNRKKPLLDGTLPIAQETLNRLGCDCSHSHIETDKGEPVSIGRKSRIWPAAMVRAIKARDQHCQFPGCTATRYLQIHHIKTWADDGETSIVNGVCLCPHHHVLVHEGGYRIQRTGDDGVAQFEVNASVSALCDVEAQLRNSQASFDQVRALLPHRYRFTVSKQSPRGESASRHPPHGEYSCDHSPANTTDDNCKEEPAFYDARWRMRPPNASNRLCPRVSEPPPRDTLTVSINHHTH